MSRIPDYIVCSPFARCGSTTIARLLADFHLLEQRELTLFETNSQSPVLENWFPDICNVVDLMTTRGQMDLFDQMIFAEPQTRIAEICSGYYRAFFMQAREIGFFEEAESRGDQPVIVFVSNGSHISVEAMTTLHALWPSVTKVVAINEGLVRLGKNLHDHLAAFPTELSFQIPALEGLPRREFEAPDFSISNFFVSTPPDDMSLVVRADLRNWMRRVFTQFHSHELRMAFDNARYLMRA